MRLPPGERLREVRHRLGITTRDVEEYSRKIAESEGNQEFYISNAWLTQLENKRSTPSIHKLLSLAAIYRIKFSDLLLFFGVDLEKISKYEMMLPVQKTQPVNLEVYDEERAVAFPVRFDPGFKAEQTSLLSRLVEIWGEVPISLIQHLDIRRGKYGYIGLTDYLMYPLLRPGSFVQVDDRQTRVLVRPWRTEFDRPIYFVELRDGYACSWCQLQGNKLTLLPHPLSPCAMRQFDYPNEAEIVGRVTAVAMRLVDYPEPARRENARLPKQS